MLDLPFRDADATTAACRHEALHPRWRQSMWETRCARLNYSAERSCREFVRVEATSNIRGVRNMEIGAAIFFTDYSITPTELAIALEQRGFSACKRMAGGIVMPRAFAVLRFTVR